MLERSTTAPPARFLAAATALLSVPFFAVPAAMLTWGFEGEAQRLAERQQRRFKRRKLYGNRFAEDMSRLGHGCRFIV